MFPYEFCDIFKNTFFTEHFWWQKCFAIKFWKFLAKLHLLGKVAMSKTQNY